MAAPTQEQLVKQLTSQYTHNPAPLLDLKQVIEQVESNTKVFRLVTILSDKKKFISQLKPESDQLPAVGFTVDFGSVTGNIVNTGMGQFLTLTLCATVVMPIASDLSGAQSHYNFMNVGFIDLNHCIYNWQPDVPNGRYTNSFSINDFQRIENLCNNAYEVYCVYYDIPCQIDYLDGYIPPMPALTQINNTITPAKVNQSGSLAMSKEIEIEIQGNN